MKSVFINRVFCGAVAIVVMGLFCAGAAFANDVVAKVGGIPITKFELQRAVEKVLPLRVSYHSGISQEKLNQVREESLEELIERAYKVRYALAEEISVDNSVVEKRIADIKSKYESEKAFEEALGTEGFSGVRAAIYRELLAKEAERVAVDDRVNVDDSEVSAFYKANKHTYMRPKRFKASHILLKIDPAANDEEVAPLKEKAEGLLARAKAGEDFHDLAYYNSDDPSKYVGGDLGYFHEGQTVKEFETAILKMKAGEVSDLVRTMYGFHIIKLFEVDEPRQLEFDEVKGDIRKTLAQRKRDALYAEWMEGLKSQYAVERF